MISRKQTYEEFCQQFKKQFLFVAVSIAILVAGGVAIYAVNNRGKPVGWWKMEEGRDTATTCDATGNYAYDSSGNANTGTLSLSGSPATSTAWSEGKFNCALSFDGADDYVDTLLTSGLSGDFAVSAWVKAASESGTHFRPIASKHTTDGGDNINTEFDFQVTPHNSLLQFFRGGCVYCFYLGRMETRGFFNERNFRKIVFRRSSS